MTDKIIRTEHYSDNLGKLKVTLEVLEGEERCLLTDNMPFGRSTRDNKDYKKATHWFKRIGLRRID